MLDRSHASNARKMWSDLCVRGDANGAIALQCVKLVTSARVCKQCENVQELTFWGILCTNNPSIDRTGNSRGRSCTH
eukprot:6179460-Pleurochrysis_carterae.AAC.1